MHTDEESTHATLTAALKGIVEPAIAQHGGRLVKSNTVSTNPDLV